MADYYTKVTIEPFIPAALVGDALLGLLGEFGFTYEQTEEGDMYFYAEEYNSSPSVTPRFAKACFPESDYGQDEDVDLEEEDLIRFIQKFIRESEGKLDYVVLRASMNCTRMRPDGFGGWALFITADSSKAVCTTTWISENIREMKKKAA